SPRSILRHRYQECFIHTRWTTMNNIKHAYMKLLPAIYTRFFLLVIMTTVETAAYGQNATARITGKVTDGNGETIVGATVQVVDGSAGTITGPDGEFKMEVDAAADTIPVKVSYLGYTTYRETIRLNGSLEYNLN